MDMKKEKNKVEKLLLENELKAL